MVEGIIYRYRTGIAWRDVPRTFGPWQTGWAWHVGRRPRYPALRSRRLPAPWTGRCRCRWILRSSARTSTRRTSPAPQGASSNYTDPLLEPPDHGFGRSRGGLSTKVHQLVDGHGLPLVTLVTPGQAGDSPMLLPLLTELRIARPVGRPRTRPDRIRGDKAYSFRAIRHLRSCGIESVIPEPRDQQGHRKRRGSPTAGTSPTTPSTTRTATSSSAASAGSSSGEA
jgi:transposase